MKTILYMILSAAIMVQVSLGSGSLPWDVVKAQNMKTDPELTKIIDATFIVSPWGEGRRMGPHFGDRHGEIISPFRFEAVNRETKEKVDLVIEESDDFHFTNRFKFTVERQENAQAGTEQPTAKPANNVPTHVEPSTATSKDTPK